MSYIILAGPALAIDPSVSRVYACVETDSDQLQQLATIEVNSKDKTKRLRFSKFQDETTLGYVLSFIAQICKQYKGESITAGDLDAVVLATALNSTLTSTNPDIIKAWVNLNFVVEVMNETANGVSTNKARFVGKNLAGIKSIVSAQSVLFTITAA